MSRLRSSWPSIIILLLAVLAALWIFSAIQVRAGKDLGIYQTPEETMYALVSRDYQGVKRIEVARMDREMFDHLRFIKAYIYADARLDGSPVSKQGYDEQSCYFVRTKRGWAFVPQNRFPKVVALGQLLFGRLG
jgi:hypothetical protein